MRRKFLSVILLLAVLLSMCPAMPLSAAAAAPPVEESAPPVEESAPPVEESAPPVEESAPPVEESAPPVEESALRGLSLIHI